MGTSHFVTRPACPACHGGNARVLYRCCFTEPPVKEYLEEFYSPQGGVGRGTYLLFRGSQGR